MSDSNGSLVFQDLRLNTKGISDRKRVDKIWINIQLQQEIKTQPNCTEL